MNFFQNIFQNTKFFILIVVILLLISIIAFYYYQETGKKLVYSAPHTIDTYRMVKNKDGELEKTLHKKESKIIEILNNLENLGENVIYNTSDTVDPNYESESSFRKQVYSGQKYNIDIHGMSNDYNYDLIIGTANQEPDLEEIKSYLDKQGLKYVINKIFSASERTITRYLQDIYQVKAIQIEMSLDFRQRSDSHIILQQIGNKFKQKN